MKSLRSSQIETLRLVADGATTVGALAAVSKSPYSSTAARVRKLVAAKCLARDGETLRVARAGLVAANSRSSLDPVAPLLDRLDRQRSILDAARRNDYRALLSLSLDWGSDQERVVLAPDPVRFCEALIRRTRWQLSRIVTIDQRTLRVGALDLICRIREGRWLYIRTVHGWETHETESSGLEMFRGYASSELAARLDRIERAIAQ